VSCGIISRRGGAAAKSLGNLALLRGYDLTEYFGVVFLTPNWSLWLPDDAGKMEEGFQERF
jgi:hypothetical protein